MDINQTPATASTNASNVISAEFKPRFFKSKKWVAVFAAVLVIAIAAVTFLSVRETPQKRLSEAFKKASQHHVNAAALNPVEQSRYFSGQQDYKAAQAVWLLQLDKAKTVNSKVADYSRLVAVAIQFKQYKEALGYAKSAQKLAPNSNAPYVSLAEVMEAEGNKAAAASYWRQAIAHLDPNAPGANLTKLSYQQNLGQDQ